MAKNSRILINIGQGLSMLVGALTVSNWNTANRPKKSKPGMVGFNTETNSLEYYDGNKWYTANMK